MTVSSRDAQRTNKDNIVNIEIDGIHKSTVTCWRELLRHLNTLNSFQLSGGKHLEMPQTNFVAFGSENPELMDPILAFMLADISVDSETRCEIFLNNIRDMCDLHLLKNIPDDTVHHVPNPEVSHEIQQLTLSLKEVKFNILMFNRDEYRYKQIEEKKQQLLTHQLQLLQNTLNTTELNTHAYVAWVCGVLVDKSTADCTQIIDASERVSASSFAQLYNSVVVQVETPEARETVLPKKRTV